MCILTQSPSGPASLLSVSCRNLSSRQEECSGPIPSSPWGSSITRPLCMSHLAVCVCVCVCMCVCACVCVCVGGGGGGGGGRRSSIHTD